MKRLSHRQFERYVDDGVEALPGWVRKKLINVAFLVVDTPSKRQRKENNLKKGETLLGLYEGVPLSDRGNEAVILPDTITIFRKPILELCRDESEVRRCVANTIWHEVA